MFRPAIPITGGVLILAILSALAAVFDGDTMALSLLGPIGLVALAQLAMLLRRTLSAWLLLVAALSFLGITLLSYLLPEYWVSLAQWDRASAWLFGGIPLDAWRPALSVTLCLMALAINVAIRSRAVYGGPLLAGIALLLLLMQLIASLIGSDYVVPYAAAPREQLLLWGLLAGQVLAALPGWRAGALIIQRTLWLALALAAMVMLFWYQQKQLTEEQLRAQVQTTGQQLADRLTREIDEHLSAMQRFANFWTLFDRPPSQAEWGHQAAPFHRDFRYFLNIAFIDPDSRVRRIYPHSDINRQALGVRLFDAQPQGRAALSQALIEQRTGRTGVIELLQGVPGIIHYLPIPLDERQTLGAVAMVVSLPLLADTLFQQTDTRQFALSLYAGQGERELLSHWPEAALGPWQYAARLDVAGQPLELRIQPSRASLVQQLPRHPAVSLVIGLTLAYLLYLMRHAYASLARQHRAAHAANAELRREIRTRTQLQKEVEWLASHDELTRLPNRRLFLDTLKANAEQLPLSVMICDIDHFKRINDHHGHLVGDRFLNQLGKIGHEIIESHGGLFARYGGEEFVACLPGTPAEQAMMAAEQIRLGLQAANLLHHDGKPLTISIGVVTQVAGAVELASLMQAADDALYRAKAEGRNRVILAHSDHGILSDS
ncbi:sensor domain-containing diguanylate cyclase [Halomonas campisalis]|uniref:diguanylate cyclase n=1 Tax=Billgrantia campisalis TaxID=74661 RepID=A0ABS9P802_9GAMM|nr:diguanylate cyclase [Halomonas campisalis]MCG6657599.1 sensor domain-containing diguanylate cyclase [Halomonas campisalis]MDR5862628.1 diguanylate cyclase [Halomonas campisalis]